MIDLVTVSNSNRLLTSFPFIAKVAHQKKAAPKRAAPKKVTKKVAKKPHAKKTHKHAAKKTVRRAAPKKAAPAPKAWAWLHILKSIAASVHPQGEPRPDKH